MVAAEVMINELMLIIPLTTRTSKEKLMRMKESKQQLNNIHVFIPIVYALCFERGILRNLVLPYDFKQN